MDFGVTQGQYNSYEELLEYVKLKSKNRSTTLIGIDGGGGSGKSTLANKLKENGSEIKIVHMDDFYHLSSKLIEKKPDIKPIGADFDWLRLLNQVLEPLSKGKEGFYQRYDWETDQLAEWHTVPIGGVVLIEGVYSTRRELVDKYDLTIWVECPREIRLTRGLERDGEEAREMWESNWMISEEIYIQKHKPDKRADIIVDGANKNVR